MKIVDAFQRFPRAFNAVSKIVAGLQAESCERGNSDPIPTPRTWMERDFSTSTIQVTKLATNPKKLR
jgi:hypothetical protein